MQNTKNSFSVSPFALKKILSGVLISSIWTVLIAPGITFGTDDTGTKDQINQGVMDKLKTNILNRKNAKQVRDEIYKTKSNSKDLAGNLSFNDPDLSKAEAIRSRQIVMDEVLIKFNKTRIDLTSKEGKQKSQAFSSSQGLDRKEIFYDLNSELFKITSDDSVDDVISNLKNNSLVVHIQPNYKYKTRSLTNDPYLSELWGLNNIGQSVNGTIGTEDADVDAPEGWAQFSQENETVVAVIDTGVGYNHPDLINMMWDGSESCFDDQGNTIDGGCPNHGWSYDSSSPFGEGNNPLPYDSAHGTHVAGIIAAESDNETGITGVGRGIKIMAILSDLTSDSIVKSINYAKFNDAQVINASWGGGGDTCDSIQDDLIFEAIQSFDGIFVAASGNGTQEHDGVSYFDFPSDFGKDTSCWNGLDNIISVAATDSNDDLASFSDYGKNFIDVGAPGTNIYSTAIENSEEQPFEEKFDDITPPLLPEGFSSTGNWGTYELFGNGDNALYGDLNFPYAADANFTFASSDIDLSMYDAASIGYFIGCDTEYKLDGWYDYMALEFSGDGGQNYVEKTRWDEPFIDSDSNEEGAASSYYSGNIDSELLTTNFRFQLRWVTNKDDNDHDGCWVDEIKITGNNIDDGTNELYDFMNGTSMATPMVAGIAGTLMSHSPQIDNSTIKSIVLSTGDSLPSLSEKTVTGKRVNLNEALNLLEKPKINFFNIEDVTTGNIAYTSGSIALTVNVTDNQNIDTDINTLDSFRFFNDNEIEITGILGQEKTEEETTVYVFDASEKDNKSVTFFAEVTDHDGNDSPLEQYTIVIDNIAPESPTIKEFINGDTAVSFDFSSFSDDGSSDTEIKYCPSDSINASCSEWTTDTVISINDLTPNTEYDLYIKARDGVWNETDLMLLDSYVTYASVEDISNPEADLGLENIASDNEIILRWSLSNSTRVTVSRDSEGLSCKDPRNEVFIASAENSLTDVGLASNTDYFYRIFAVNSNGEINTENCISLQKRTLPGPVQNVQTTQNIVNTDNSTASVSWSWDGVFEADEYRVYINKGITEKSESTGNITSATSFTRNNLPLNSVITFEVAAIRDGEEGQKSDLISIITGSAQPTNVGFENKTKNTITWTWSNNNSTGYYVRVTDEDGEVHNSGWINGQTSSWVGSGYRPNTEYTIYIKSKNLDGIETSETEYSTYTSISSPDTPIITEITNNGFTVSIDELENIESGDSGYLFDIGEVNSGWTQDHTWSPVELSGNTVYELNINARNALAERGDSIESVEILTKPNAPDFILNPAESTSISIVVNTNGALEYFVELASDSEFESIISVLNWELHENQGVISFTDLGPNKTYYVRAKSKNATGISTENIWSFQTALPELSDSDIIANRNTNSWHVSAINTIEFLNQNIDVNLFRYKWDMDPETEILSESLQWNSMNPLELDISETGQYYLHVAPQREEDIGNTLHLGPYKFDMEAPTMISLKSDAYNANKWGNIKDLLISWNLASDDGSGVNGYHYLLDNNINTPYDSAVFKSTNNNLFRKSDISDGIYYFHIVTKDNAGNISSPTNLGPIMVDRTPGVISEVTSIINTRDIIVNFSESIYSQENGEGVLDESDFVFTDNSGKNKNITEITMVEGEGTGIITLSGFLSDDDFGPSASTLSFAQDSAFDRAGNISNTESVGLSTGFYEAYVREGGDNGKNIINDSNKNIVQFYVKTTPLVAGEIITISMQDGERIFEFSSSPAVAGQTITDFVFNVEDESKRINGEGLLSPGMYNSDANLVMQVKKSSDDLWVSVGVVIYNSEMSSDLIFLDGTDDKYINAEEFNTVNLSVGTNSGDLIEVFHSQKQNKPLLSKIATDDSVIFTNVEIKTAILQPAVQNQDIILNLFKTTKNQERQLMSEQIILQVDKFAPSIEINSPNNNAEVYGSSIELSGRVIDSDLDEFKINEESTAVSQSYWSKSVNLNHGGNQIELIASDYAGNQESTNYNIIRKPVLSNIKAVLGEVDNVIISWSTDASTTNNKILLGTSIESLSEFLLDDNDFLHQKFIYNLEPATKYFFQVQSTRREYSTQSEILSFYTPTVIPESIQKDIVAQGAVFIDIDVEDKYPLGGFSGNTITINSDSEEVIGSLLIPANSTINVEGADDWNGVISAPRLTSIAANDIQKINKIKNDDAVGVTLHEKLTVGSDTHELYFEDPVTVSIKVDSAEKDAILHAYYSHNGGRTYAVYNPDVSCIVNEEKICELNLPHFSEIILGEDEISDCTADDWTTGEWTICTNQMQSRVVQKKNSCIGEYGKPSLSQVCLDSVSSTNYTSSSSVSRSLGGGLGRGINHVNGQRGAAVYTPIISNNDEPLKAHKPGKAILSRLSRRINTNKPSDFRDFKGIVPYPMTIKGDKDVSIDLIKGAQMSYLNRSSFGGVINPPERVRADEKPPILDGYEALSVIKFETRTGRTIQFSEPFTISMPLPSVKISEEILPKIYYFDESKQKYRVASGKGVQIIEGRKISAKADHTGIFAVLVPIETNVEMTQNYSKKEELVRFRDILDHWAELFVHQLTIRGVFDNEESFRPNDGVLRAELTKTIVEAFNIPFPISSEVKQLYSDVSLDMWYSKYIDAASKFNVVQGYPGGEFQPAKVVNRAEALKMIVSASGIQQFSAPHELPFRDVPHNAWYHRYVGFALQNGIVSGRSSEEFAPSEPVTRAEIAKMVYRMQEFLFRGRRE